MRAQTVGYIATAFGLVAGLAWNDAIKAFIENIFPLGQGTMWAKFIYAVIITIFVVVITRYLLRLANRK
ncbi:hypothetical protein A2Z10_02950 [Candidatus Azambacteria bacterium RBG_16_47_10]|uniref:Uncharacterized protein n=1 Tax=Candidatus Azambacteria bacterium RBG_16_47_10 TaxID=1797292 RepID=A0A1F5B119_9BACT|nr:MAG: hypothetical protein A2Z10_02950 [Candidatus Azambacteria bacterium RBG_16_47_10]